MGLVVIEASMWYYRGLYVVIIEGDFVSWRWMTIMLATWSKLLVTNWLANKFHKVGPIIDGSIIIKYSYILSCYLVYISFTHQILSLFNCKHYIMRYNPCSQLILQYSVSHYTGVMYSLTSSNFPSLFLSNFSLKLSIPSCSHLGSPAPADKCKW